jgi:integrase/recombinase XerD
MEKQLQEFASYLESTGYNESSQRQITKSVREFLARLPARVYQVKGIKPQHIQKHYAYLNERPNERRAGGLASGVILGYMGALRLFFSYLQQTGELHENPMSKLSFQGSEYNPREILTEKEIKKLYKQCENLRDRAILALFYGCGLRRSEAENVDIRDIHFKSKLLYVREGKGKKRRVVPLSTTVAEDLRNYYLYERSSYIKQYDNKQESAFILNNWGRRMAGQLYLRRLNFLLGKTSIKKDICLHSLRHSIATHLLERGLDVEHIRDFLGHALFETTEKYTRVSGKLLKKL